MTAKRTAAKPTATKARPAATPIDQYLARVTPGQRAALQALRRIIRAAAPAAEEGISYRLAAFRLNGPLVAFGAGPNHCALYLMSGSTVAAHAKALARYDTSKGTIRFQPDAPLPAALVRTLVKARVAENAARASGRRKPAAGSAAPRSRSSSRRLPPSVVKALDATKYLGLRVGARTDHRFIGIWVVVVEGRAFARSWTLKPDGWFRAVARDAAATLRIGERTVRVRCVRVAAPRLLDAIEHAYADKYNTPGSLPFVRGFRTSRRRAATVEFVPR
jgi:uncharacterized protein YdhG (YjbR/CyaY superfamily)